MRRKFNWALYACVTWGVVACGGTPIGGATVGNPPDQNAGGSSSGGASNIGSAGDMTLPTSGGGTFNFVEGPEPDAGGSGSVNPTPVGGGSLCGNGTLDDGEQCDDGNAHPGDGCSGTCQLEPNFSCPTAGASCVTTIVCGDGHIAGEEACDDGNTADGDGCSHDCRVEGGYDCTGGTGSLQSGQCQPVTQETCGDARITGTEACDDGNATDGDGCSHDCQIETGYTCPNGAGALCVREGRCGDNTVNVSAGEQCDDGNTTGGDGCSATCKVEALYTCPPNGGSCTSMVVCGDGVVNGNEQCDDHNTDDGDGCDSNCQVEPGFVCAKGDVCRTVCGDGIRAGNEQCDDGNNVDGSPSPDGCDKNCRLEDGFACVASSAVGHDVCHTTTCGDGVQEGTEQCDDGNLAAYDGCDPNCHNEPVCGISNSVYGCSAVCGDGMKFPGEGCDDGNTNDGDGCSHDCKVEAGFTCADNAPDLGSTLNLPVIYHDFQETHPQFEINPQINTSNSDGRLPNIVQSTLGSDGKPVYNQSFKPAASNTTCGGSARAFTMDGPGRGSSTAKSSSANDTGYSACNTATLTTTQQIADAFAQWYQDVPGTNIKILGTLALGETAPGTYQFARSGSNEFFPLDLQGFGNQGQQDGSGNSHNFHFTSEVRQWFLHGVGSDELLTFTGDDDVWVFVNGQLTVDLGGIHGELQGSIELKGTNGELSQLCLPTATGDGKSAGTRTCSSVSVPINANGVNEIAVFQAERHVTQSNYTLTLQGFNAPVSVCTSHCGDGVVTADEACDLGTANNTGAYGTCNADCTLPSRCGDGVVDASDGEECDNGVNISTRLYNAGDCAPGCKLPPRCGDGNIDSSFGELCDDGVNNSDSAYGKNLCNTACRPAPFCGDHTVNVDQGEVCDDGKNDGTPGSCSSDCKHAIPLPSCGDGVQDPGEQCDNGSASNGVVASGHINSCDTHCQHSCGNGIVDMGEQCDDGVNDGSYGTCNHDCTLAGYCGDGQVNGSEICDNGVNNVATASAYGPGVCTTACAAAPRCGDQRVDSSFGESCDGSPGCTNQCSIIH